MRIDAGLVSAQGRSIANLSADCVLAPLNQATPGAPAEASAALVNALGAVDELSVYLQAAWSSLAWSTDSLAAGSQSAVSAYLGTDGAVASAFDAQSGEG